MSARKRTSQLVREITSLPALPPVVQRLLAVLQDPDYTAEQVTAVVRTDPALTARVLKLANSPAFGAPRTVDGVARAVVILGSRNLRSLVTAAGMAEAVARMRGGADHEDLWCHAAWTATAAQVLATRSGHPCPEEAFLAGLIHDIGELALAVVRPREYARLRGLPVERQLDAEREILGMTHTRAGQQLLSAWNLPEEVAAFAGQHHLREAVLAPENRTLAVVALADLLSRIRGLGREAPPEEWLARKLVDLVAPKSGLSAELLRQIDLRYLETSRFLHPERARIQAPFCGGEPRRVTLVGADPQRSLWLHELLSYHGQIVVPFTEYFAAPESVDLVLLDPRSLDHHALARVAPALALTPDRLALYADPDVNELADELPPDLPVLPIFFGRQEFDALPAAEARTLSPR